MSLKKKFLKSKPLCKVTFSVPKEAVEDAKLVNLVGDFNNWDVKETTMRKLKDGSYTRTLDLETGKEYEFRYLLDGENWINDTQADKYVPSGVGFDSNCVLEV